MNNILIAQKQAFKELKQDAEFQAILQSAYVPLEEKFQILHARAFLAGCAHTFERTPQPLFDGTEDSE